jgi:hypothetical protein
MNAFECKYCNKKFAKESTIQVHICVGKQRALVRDEKHVNIAFTAYQKFYRMTQNINADRTYEDFCKSPFYAAFVKFGSFANNVNPLYLYKFIDYVIKSGKKLEHWCDEELYQEYVISLIKSESVETALERAVNTMLEWSQRTNLPWNEYFLHVSPNRAYFDITDGKISPWVVLNSNNGKRLVQKFDDFQLKKIEKIINPQFWLIKFQRQSADTILVKQIIKDGNI